MCSSPSLRGTVLVVKLDEYHCIAFQESVCNNPGKEQRWSPVCTVPRDMVKATFDGRVVSVTILMSGMRRFAGSFTRNFAVDETCFFFVKNKPRIQFTYKNGLLDGIYREFNEKGEKAKSIMFRDGKMESVINDGKKCLKDERHQGTGLFGECCDSSDMAWNGLVFRFENNRPVKLFFYEYGEFIYDYGSFEEKEGVLLYVQYTRDKRVLYCGEYLIDEKEGEVYYHGYGILFGVMEGRFGCVYKGNFNRGKFNGFGSSFDLKTGLKKEEGIWKDGMLENGDSFVEGMLKNNVVSEIGHFAALGKNPGKVLIENGPLSREMSDAVFGQGAIVRARAIVCGKDALKAMRSFRIVGYPNLDELVLSENCLGDCEQVVIESGCLLAR